MATVEREKERLKELSSAEYQQDLYLYNNRERRTYVEVLADFPSARPPLQYLIDWIPRLLPRQFSISSSPKAHLARIHITVALIQYETPFKRKKVGICSAFLASLDSIKDEIFVPIWCKRGSLRLPREAENEKPIIMVGPGTGIAPFRSMAYHRDALIQEVSSKVNLGTPKYGPITLYMGHRTNKHDFLYGDSMHHLTKSGAVEHLHCAFSRDQPDKIYVQHLLIRDGKQVWDILTTQQGYLFLAGNAKQMPRDVREALMKIAECEGGLSQEQATSFIKKTRFTKTIPD